MSGRSLARISRKFHRGFYTSCKWKSDKSENSNETVLKKIDERSLPEEPTYCCKSACSNCVWIKYAQEITQLFEDGDKIAKQKISEKVQDPNLRAFLFTQLGLNEVDSKN